MVVKAKTDDVSANSKAQRRSRISQTDVPAHGLTDALRVANAIAENYASDATSPLDVAAAMGLTPTSSNFKMLAGASIAYGLTEGGYNVSQISLTNLGRRITSPLEDGDDEQAKREALQKPRVIGEFLAKYDQKQLPRPDIAINVLATMDCPRERASDIFELIVSEAEALGLIQDIKGKKFVNLRGSARGQSSNGNIKDLDGVEPLHTPDQEDAEPLSNVLPDKPISLGIPLPIDNKAKRVFITHGRDQGFVQPIKKLLSFGEMEAVVSVEKQSVSKPVPEKVMADMRSCGAAIIHVDAENRVMDTDAKEHVMLNSNVLIEIGAAMALYGQRFILLVRDGVKLPSNLQGLYEVRYSGEALDGDATIKLMEAINALKTERGVKLESE